MYGHRYSVDKNAFMVSNEMKKSIRTYILVKFEYFGSLDRPCPNELTYPSQLATDIQRQLATHKTQSAIETSRRHAELQRAVGHNDQYIEEVG